MRTVVALVTLFAFVAHAQETLPTDRPAIVYVHEGTAVVTDQPAGEKRTVKLPPGMCMNNKAVLKLDTIVQALQRDNADVIAQNEELRKKLDEYAAEPSVSPKVAVVLAVGGALLGAAAAVYLTK